jgi:hypothetical protein
MLLWPEKLTVKVLFLKSQTLIVPSKDPEMKNLLFLVNMSVLTLSVWALIVATAAIVLKSQTLIHPSADPEATTESSLLISQHITIP